MHSRDSESGTNTWTVITSQELEALRNLIYDIERELAKLGMDFRRGIESYGLSELKSLLTKSPNREQVRELLLKLLELQENLYRELYGIAGLKEMSTDTDMPEKRVSNIREWLLSGSTRSSPKFPAESKQSTVMRRLADLLAGVDSEDECSKEVVSLLESSYKRNYDRLRVLRIVLKACVHEGVVTWESVEKAENSLYELVSILLACRKSLGRERLSALIAGRGKSL